ncbi:MarR family transcriptional regulator [Blastomonas sp. AAP53]|uniref:MarR family winged helix-turn-helix transcriptional regulator n=1 Tax=Blastomonas sp. AAP53 TaxID=1248760 RepID=UPI000315B706|nr:MarR family transcriptional regulator [Blastomonas sp. AAP53]
MPTLDAISGSRALAKLVGFQLHLANMRVMQAARTALADRNTTPAKVTAMLFVLDNPGCDQTTLSKFMHVGRSAIMKLLNTMEQRGHVERRSGRDLRSNGLYLTAAGEAFLAEALALIEESDRDMTASLTQAEQAQLIDLLHKLQGS